MTRQPRVGTQNAPTPRPNPAPFPYHNYVAAQEELRSALCKGPVYAELTGRSGTGKSSLLREWTDSLDLHHFQPVYLSSSGTSLTNVARFIARTVRVPPKRTHLETVQSLLDVLTTQPANLVVFLDEADRVEARALYELRVLAECHRPGQQSFSVVLSGLPALHETLNSPFLFPLKRNAHELSRRCPLGALLGVPTGQPDVLFGMVRTGAVVRAADLPFAHLDLDHSWALAGPPGSGVDATRDLVE